MNAFGMIAGSTVLIIPLALINDGVPTLDLTTGTWASLFSLSLLSTVLAYILYFKVLVRVGSANLMLVTLLIPPFAIGLGVVFLGERLGLDAWIGFALIAVGLVITDGRLMAKLRS